MVGPPVVHTPNHTLPPLPRIPFLVSMLIINPILVVGVDHLRVIHSTQILDLEVLLPNLMRHKVHPPEAGVLMVADPGQGVGL